MSDAATPTALIFGATGYTGRYLVHGLLGRGLRTVAHIRTKSSKVARLGSEFESAGAQVALEDWEEGAIAALVERVQPTVVFGVLGTTRSRMKHDSRASYEAVDYGLTAMAHRACEISQATPRFVYLSAMGVRASARMPYMAVRWRMEKELQAGKTPWMIVRPGFISGSDRDEFRLGERLAANVSDGFLAVAGLLGGRRMRSRFSSMSGRELADGMIDWALSPEGAGRIVSTSDLRAKP